MSLKAGDEGHLGTLRLTLRFKPGAPHVRLKVETKELWLKVWGLGTLSLRWETPWNFKAAETKYLGTLRLTVEGKEP